MTARRRRPRFLVALTSLGVALGLVTVPQQVAGAAPCDAPVVSQVACENTKPGNPESEWGITGAGSSSIQGFATDMSVDQGQTVGFKIDTPATSYALDIYRMGYYGGAGARKVATVQPSRVTGSQPACRTDSNTGLVDCGNWTQNASWTVPADAVSGIYFAKLNRTDGTAGSSHVFFVVRDDDGRSALLFQTSDTTWQAYNRYGGNSLYTGSPAGRAYKVSYNRPFTTRDYAAEDFVFNSEYPMVRFLESNGYDVSYFSGVDTDRRGAELLEHKAFLSVGHDEYWSGPQRTNVEAARAAGVHLAFFSGNEVFWKTRWENSIDGSGTAFRTLVSYKETHANAVIDPADPPTWTGTWRDPRFSPPADGGRPENALTGTIFKANCCKAEMYVGAADGAMRFWRNTPVAGLTGSQTRKIGSEVIGYEWDEDADNGYRPAGLFRLSETTASGDMLQNYGSSYATGTATHSMTMYRHSSGALVFGAGTIQWPWALDGKHDKGTAAPDVAAQQATVNLFADMGVQPTTLQSGLVAATASNDTAVPTSAITSPSTGQTVPVGSPVVISGTATDAGGGKVAGIEVSTDGGNTWRRASGRQSWTYTYTPTTAGTFTVRSRAVDDTGNLETPSAGITLTVGNGQPPSSSCPCSIWADTAVPDRTDSDSKAVELGTKFRASQNGFITGIRFYKQTATTGTHVGSLWNSAGTRLASVTFTNESASGWQQATFSAPVAVTANTTYLASYHAPNGKYGVSSSYFATAPTVRGPLTALQNGTDGGNGVYRYTTTAGAFPTSSFQGENYWVDVIFTTDGTTPTDTTKPTVTSRTPADGATNVPVSATVSATFSEPVTASTPSVAVRTDAGTQVAGTVAYTAGTQTVTFTPASPLAEATRYTVTVTGATDTAGNTMDPATWTFTTAAPAADTTKPTLTGRSPATGATGVATTSTVTATFSEAVDPATPVVDLRTSGGTAVSGSMTYTASTNTVTFAPSAALQPGTTYTATVSGAKDAAGNVMDPASWSFTTAAAAGSCPCTIWADTATPATPAQSDSKATEVGVKFRASQNGFVSGIRFYKGTGNTGTHVGSLWSATGTRLATATFANETATGWQQVSFPAPVAITAGTTYVASYHAPVGRYAIDSNYFTSSATVRGPLTALQNGTDGGNGVYRYSTTAGTFPTSTYQSSNYWVDVVFAPDSAPPADTTRPTVTARTPAAGATGVPVSTTVTATFSEPVSSASLVLKDDAGASVAGSTTYTASTQTLTFTANAALASGKSYTATVSGATDAAGNTMDAVTWTFTTAAQGSGTCPCTIWPATATPATSSASDSSAVEVGVRFRAEQNGYITGVRFYKGTGNTGTHVGSLWSTSGTRLASVTFTGETATGWQQATFGAPVPVVAGTTYIASYHAPSGHYANDNGYFAAAPVSRGPLTALQDGPGTTNGVYAYGGPGTFPTSTFSSTSYWVDVVFDVTAADTVAPTVVGRAPAPGATDVPASSPVTATFNEPVDAASVVMQLRAPGGAVVPAAVTYDAASLTATLRPNAALSTSTTYTMQVSGAKDGSGNTMQSDSWTFSTAAPPPPPPDQGSGGPIAVVKSSTNPSSAYLAEILRAEGITHFTTVEASTLTSGVLGGYDVVVLGDVPLTAAQVTAIGDWVQAGGNLVAMKPDQRLAPLLGLTAQSGTTDDAYLAVDQTTSAGAGITPETIQYKGPADRYALAGAQAVARLYSTATSATAYPAVTVRDVGTNGGQAAAFTYDLATSVIRQRQGNPAWAGQERDGRVVIRTDDMFFGGSSPDWVDFNKVQIPQADEQQRLLVNLMTVMDRDRMPLPRFWYFPNMNKAVVVATGDDHGKNGTAGRFDRYSAMSPAGCSVDDWQCLRFSSYIYPDTPLTPAQASTYTSQGFEVGLHVNNGCRDYTSRSDLEASYTTDLTSWRQRYGGIPSPDSNRIHCLVWSDWSSHPLVELGQNMRLDVNYYYWPQEWVKDRPGFMTGSGMPMRLTDTGGTMLDVYQATTQMTDESGQSYPFTPATLLDRALGPLGYYGAFTANMHTDTATSAQDDGLLSAATSRGVPMVSGRQMLRWLDGRNASAYKNLKWSTDRLTFTLSPGTGARGLTGMLPTTGPGGRVLSTVTRGGSTVSFAKVTIKGQEYGVFGGAAGDYVAVYGGGQAAAPTATTSSVTTSDVTTTSATVSWTTSTPGSSVLSLGTSPQQLDTTVKAATSSTQHETALTGLDSGRTYFYRVTSTDAQGRRSVWPADGTMPAMFTTAPPDSRNPSVSNVEVQPLPDGTARVTWNSDEVTTGTVDLGTSTSTLKTGAMSGEESRQHTALLTDLRPGATYLVGVRSTDAAGNTGTQVVPTRFVASAPGVADHTGAQLMSGNAGPGIRVDRSAEGAITLKGRSTGTFTSRVMDAQQMVEWDRATWTATAPAGASLRVSVRLGSTSQPDGTWTAWQPLSATGDRVLGHSRYLQYRLELTAAKDGAAPNLTAIGFTHNGSLPHSDKETP